MSSREERERVARGERVAAGVIDRERQGVERGEEYSTDVPIKHRGVAAAGMGIASDREREHEQPYHYAGQPALQPSQQQQAEQLKAKEKEHEKHKEKLGMRGVSSQPEQPGPAVTGPGGMLPTSAATGGIGIGGARGSTGPESSFRGDVREREKSEKSYEKGYEKPFETSEREKEIEEHFGEPTSERERLERERCLERQRRGEKCPEGVRERERAMGAPRTAAAGGTGTGTGTGTGFDKETKGTKQTTTTGGGAEVGDKHRRAAATALHGHRLPPNVEEGLVKQARCEFASGQCYLAASLWFADRNLHGFAKMLKRFSKEECVEGHELLEYIIKRRGHFQVREIPAPKECAQQADQVVECLYKKAVDEMGDINELLLTTRKEGDYNTELFLHKFVKDSTEDVDLLHTLWEKTRDNMHPIGMLHQLDAHLLDQEEDLLCEKCGL